MNRFLATTFLIGLVTANCNFASAELSDFADGKRDATSSLQSLADSGAKLIEIPPGTYLITRPIEIDLDKTGYCSLRGSSATKIVMKGTGPAFRFNGTHLKSADPSGFEQRVWDRQRMPQVLDLAIEGAHPEADGIEAVGTMQLTVSRVHLRKLRHGVRLVKNNRNVIVESCHIYQNSGVGLFLDNVNLHQINVTGCHISYCDQGGIVSRAGNVRNLHITGCDLESNMSADEKPTANVFIDCRGSSYGTAEVAITGCTIQHNDNEANSANIRIHGGSKPTEKLPKIQEGHITITGNILSDVQHNIWLDSCRGVTITGNTCWMGFQHNLLLENCSHLVVGPNNFDRNPRYAYGHSTDAQNRLVFRSCKDCTVSGLHVALVTGPGLSMTDCDRMNVSGLTILDCDVGVQLKNVSRSRFANCLIRDDRSDAKSVKLSSEGGVENKFDDSFGP